MLTFHDAILVEKRVLAPLRVHVVVKVLVQVAGSVQRIARDEDRIGER